MKIALSTTPPRTRPPNWIAALVRRTRLPRGRLPDKLGYVKRAFRKLPQLLGARGASGESFLWQLRSRVRTATGMNAKKRGCAAEPARNLRGEDPCIASGA